MAVPKFKGRRFHRRLSSHAAHVEVRRITFKACEFTDASSARVEAGSAGDAVEASAAHLADTQQCSLLF
jgi:hypothetical protein